MARASGERWFAARRNSPLFHRSLRPSYDIFKIHRLSTPPPLLRFRLAAQLSVPFPGPFIVFKTVPF